MKACIIYHSQTGHTKEMADSIAEGMNEVSNIEAKTFDIDNIDDEWIKESKCIILGTPIYLANMSGKVKTWLDTNSRLYGLSGKIGGTFATADYVHGGAEIAMQNILSHMLVLGMMTYSGGGSYGKPVIHLGPVALSENLNKYKENFKIYGNRMAMKTAEVFK